MSKKLHESIADIAYIAGHYGYYSGDSRADMQTFILCAEKFQERYHGMNWDTQGAPDYIESIDAFVEDSLGKLRRPIDFIPAAAKQPWDCIEVEAIYDDGNSATPVQHLDSGDYPVSYHSLYLHQVEGGVQCIADVPTEEDAIKLRELIETAVRTFTKNDNSDFVDLKPRLIQFLEMKQRSTAFPQYMRAIGDVLEFINNYKDITL